MTSIITMSVVPQSNANSKSLNLCKGKMLKEEEVESIILNQLRKTAQRYVDKAYILKNANTGGQAEQLDQEKRLKKKLENQLDENQQICMSLYKDKVNGIVTGEQFQELANHLNEEKQALKRQIQAVTFRMEKLKNLQMGATRLEGQLSEFLQFKKIDRSILTLLIERVMIYPDGKYEFYYTFQNPETIKR